METTIGYGYSFATTHNLKVGLPARRESEVMFQVYSLNNDYDIKHTIEKFKSIAILFLVFCQS